MESHIIHIFLFLERTHTGMYLSHKSILRQTAHIIGYQHTSEATALSANTFTDDGSYTLFQHGFILAVDK